MTYVNISQIAFIGKVSLHLQAHLAPSWDCKEGSGCAFFVPQDAQVKQSSFTAHGAALLRQYIWFTSPSGDRTCCSEPEWVVALALCHWYSESRDGTGTL